MISSAESMTRELRAVSRKLLEEGDVALVIGYGASSCQGSTRPLFVTKAEQSSSLIWNSYCVANLAVYLTKAEVQRLGRPAIVAKGCDIRSLIVLAQENQLRREDVVILGVACQGAIDCRTQQQEILPKCFGCEVRTPADYDHLIGKPVPADTSKKQIDAMAEIEEMVPEERWRYWTEELERCIKCYACRAVCPQCYCKRCFVETTQPAWTSNNQSPYANYVFHLFRAFHLAGRCVGCGECARVCPQDIPLGILNQKMAREVEDLYGHVAGTNLDAPAPLLVHRDDDEGEFFR